MESGICSFCGMMGMHSPECPASIEEHHKKKEAQMISREGIRKLFEKGIFEEAEKLKIHAENIEQLKTQIAEMRAQTREEIKKLDVTIDQDVYLTEFEKLSVLDKIDSLISVREQFSEKK